jgi:hypothetical protein
MKRGLIFTLVVVLVTPATAQITFERIYDYLEYGMEVLQTDDGGYVFVGSIYGDAYIARTNQYGDTLWVNVWGQAYIDEAIHCIDTDINGDYLLAGRKGGTMFQDFYLAKTDTLGDTLWTQRYSTLFVDETVFGMTHTSDGGCILAGCTDTNGYDIYLVRTDSTGDTLWTRTYGGPDLDVAYEIIQTQDDYFMLTGGSETYGGTYNTCYLMKLDSNGDSLWVKTYPSQCGYDLKATSDGGYIIAGGDHTLNFRLIRLDADGDTLWTRAYGDYLEGWPNGVCLANDGGFVVVGSGGGPDVVENAFMFKCDVNGDSLWMTKFGPDNTWETFMDVQSTSDGGYITVGYLTWGGAYLVKTNSTGLEVEENRVPALPTTLEITAAPNPFNPTTRILFALPKAGEVCITAYNILGQRIAIVHAGAMQAGHHEITWDASGMPSGVYLVRLSAGENVATTKVVLLR